MSAAWLVQWACTSDLGGTAGTQTRLLVPLMQLLFWGPAPHGLLLGLALLQLQVMRCALTGSLIQALGSSEQGLLLTDAVAPACGAPCHVHLSTADSMPAPCASLGGLLGAEWCGRSIMQRCSAIADTCDS